MEVARCMGCRSVRFREKARSASWGKEKRDRKRRRRTGSICRNWAMALCGRKKKR
jgi:hypothetical protein